MLDWLEENDEKLDICLVGEPSNPMELGEMVKIGRRGSMNMILTVKGTQGHVAYPHLADNAAHRLVAMLDALTAEPLDDGNEHFQASSLQITSIDIGNPTENVIPGEAEARFNIRLTICTRPTVSRSGFATSWTGRRMERPTISKFGSAADLSSFSRASCPT